MALDLLKGAAQGIAGRTLKKVAGNIRGGLLNSFQRGGSNLSGSAGLTNTKFSTKNYSFPLDVEGPPGTGNQGHYIIFYVNQQTNAKLSFGKPATAEGRAQMAKAQKEQGNVPASNVSVDPTGNVGGAAAGDKAKRDKAIQAKAEDLKKVSTVAVARPPTVRMDTAITLYMPPQVQVTYGANFTDTPIGESAAIGAQAYADIVAGKAATDTIISAAKSVGEELGEGAIRKLLGAVDMIPGLEGVQEVVDIQRGFVKTPRLELAFKGIPKRAFQYSFTMIPKSAEEANEIQKIIQAFKLNMLPEMKQGSVNRLTTPNTFDIAYMYNGRENQKLHKISTCVLESMSVTYGGDRYKTFEADADGAPPVMTQIQLAFKEMDLITREKANEGF
tara:strand:+ start:1187 stop:2350 length:1164 start_codon:yes stop_codon:yes gene_type:complete